MTIGLELFQKAKYGDTRAGAHPIVLTALNTALTFYLSLLDITLHLWQLVNVELSPVGGSSPLPSHVHFVVVQWVH